MQLPPVPKTARPLEADVILRLRESGGRTIERTVTLPVDLEASRASASSRCSRAAKARGGRDRPLRGRSSLGADGKRVAANGLKWELTRLEHQLAVVQPRRLVELRGRRPSRARSPSGTVDATADGAPAKIEAKVDWGRYRLEVSIADPDGPASSIVFNAGYYADEDADSPEMLDVALDKRQLQGGRDGQAPHCLEHGRQGADRRAQSRPASARRRSMSRTAAARCRCRVGDDWGAGAYVTAMLYRPHGREGQAHAEPRHRPALAAASTRRRARSTLRLDAPEKVKSGADPDRAGQDRRPGGRRGGARHASPPSTSASSTSRASRRPRRRTGSSASAGSAPRSATSTAA